MHLNSGTRLGACEIVGLLGAGGMGEVYRRPSVKITLASARNRSFA